MKLLIDGYNLLKKIKKTSYITDSERNKFLKQLNNYAHQKKLSIIIVFDGGPFNWPQHEKMSSVVEVIYSGAQQNADTYIKQYLDEHANKELLLISSDRELVNYAHNHNVISLDSYTFSELLYHNQSLPKIATHKEPLRKLTIQSTPELDILMEQLKVPTKTTEDRKRERGKTHTLSKEERKLLQKLKKL